MATCLTKLSVLALIYRVTSVVPGWTKNLAVVVAVTVALDALVFILVSIFQCMQVHPGRVGTIPEESSR